MAENQLERYTKCNRELPLDAFGKGNSKDGKRSWCKECMREYAKEANRKKSLKLGLRSNPALSEFTPQQLITELRVRGYTGDLVYKEVKIHKIKV